VNTKLMEEATSTTVEAVAAEDGAPLGDSGPPAVAEWTNLDSVDDITTDPAFEQRGGPAHEEDAHDAGSVQRRPTSRFLQCNPRERVVASAERRVGVQHLVAPPLKHNRVRL
jgi:hypothetical protein